MKHISIQPASLSFNEDGTPVARDFDDIYFSNENGLAETRHVFLGGNHLPERFATHHRPVFVVAESGFGTGLNFLALCQAFDEFCLQHADAGLKRLHYISVEKFPLTAPDLALAHRHWPELSRFATELQRQWPLPVSGCHRLLLDNGRITLDVWFGEINQLISQWDDSLNHQVDAWFLDGFAPVKNPDMWTPGLFNTMARMTRPGGTLATFTSAGFVRRGLLAAGFTVTKSKGFGRKREMLIGSVQQGSAPAAARTPWYARPGTHKRETAIVGGGIASALLALALLRRGWQVTLYCEDGSPAQGASGNRQGALYPLISPHDEALTAFFLAAFTFAKRLYDTLPITFDHAWCGVTQLAWDEKSAHKIAQLLAAGLPDLLATAVDAETVAKTCGVETQCGGVSYPLGGWLCPAQLTASVLDLATRRGLKSHYGHRVTDLTPDSQGWTLTFAQQDAAHHAAVVLANGHQISQFSRTQNLPVYAVGGQVSHIPTNPALSQLRQVLCYNGYLTPVNPQNHQHCIGASYHRGRGEMACTEQDQQHNRQRLLDCLPQAGWAKTVDVSGNQARCGVRCASRDHLPMVGSVPDYTATLEQYAGLAGDRENAAPSPNYNNLYMLGALGSRGLCSAPLASEILAAQMSEEPLPLDAVTLAALNPNRFWVRKLLQGKMVR